MLYNALEIQKRFVKCIKIDSTNFEIFERFIYNEMAHHTNQL